MFLSFRLQNRLIQTCPKYISFSTSKKNSPDPPKKKEKPIVRFGKPTQRGVSDFFACAKRQRKAPGSQPGQLEARQKPEKFAQNALFENVGLKLKSLQKQVFWHNKY